MTTELATLLTSAKYADDKTFIEVASSSSFLPRLQLFGSNSDAVKEGTMPMANYGLVRGKQIEDLTKEVHILILSWRPKALEIDQGEGTILSVFNPEDPDFKRIAEKSDVQNSGAMFGPEFLVYIPAIKAFATFFMASKTSRREAPNVKALMGKFGTLKSQYIKNKKYSWHGPLVTPCSQTFELPPDEEIRTQITKFNSPPENETEPVPENEAARPR